MSMVVSESEAALLLSKLLDRVSNSGEEVMIERSGREPVVMLPLQDYLTLTASLVAQEPRHAPQPQIEAEIFSLDARRRHRRDRERQGTTRRTAR